MNKLHKWFYKRAKVKMLQEIEEYGLRILDEEKFDRHVINSSKKSMVNSFILVILVIAVIIKWLYGG